MTKDIQKAICKSEVLKSNIPCENVSMLFSHEADVLSMNKNGYLIEFEVKISRSDFLADLKKSKWQFYEHKAEKSTPNYFYYVCPKNLILLEEIQNFAGLIYFSEEGLEVIKNAKLLHKYKRDKVEVLTKFSRVMSERMYLGGCRLTYENKERRKQREARESSPPPTPLQ